MCVFGIGAWGLELGVGIWGLGFKRLWVLEFRVSGFGFRVSSNCMPVLHTKAERAGVWGKRSALNPKPLNP